MVLHRENTFFYRYTEKKRRVYIFFTAAYAVRSFLITQRLMNSGQETYQSIEKQQSNLQREKDSQPANSFTQSLLLGTFPITEREAFSLSVPDIYTSGPLIRSRLYLHNLGTAECLLKRRR